MEETFLENNTLVCLKFIQSMLVQQDVKEFLEEAKNEEFDYTSIAMLQLTRDYVKALTMDYSLPDDVKYNVESYVSTCRFEVFNQEESEDERKKRFEISNDIVCLIHGSYGKEPYPYFPSLINHFYPHSFSRTLMHLQYLSNTDIIKEQLCMLTTLEYYILLSHLILEDEEFMEIGVAFLLQDSYFIGVTALLDSYPYLEDNPTFLKRVKKILTYNEELLAIYHGAPEESSDYYLEESDMDIVGDRRFWKQHQKLKKKMAKLKKGS